MPSFERNISSSVMLDSPVDESDISDNITRFDVQPVEDLNDWNLTGTVFYHAEDSDVDASVRRWFLVEVDRLESGDAEATIDVYDQIYLGVASRGSVGEPAATNHQTLEETFDEPDSEPILPWERDVISRWLTEWDEENPPEFELPV